MKRCPDCDTLKDATEFFKNKARKDGLQSVCKVCISKRNKKWYNENREDHNRYMREHAKKNRPMYNARDSKRRSAELNATPSWANTEQIKRIYETCYKVSKRTGVIHHVDHIYPLQGKTVCGLHVENNLAIIPAKMNLSKGNNVIGGQPNTQGNTKGNNNNDA